MGQLNNACGGTERRFNGKLGSSFGEVVISPRGANFEIERPWKLSIDLIVFNYIMLKRLLIIQLALALSALTGASAFASSNSPIGKLATSNLNHSTIICAQMSNFACSSTDMCLAAGHTGCDSSPFQLMSTNAPSTLGFPDPMFSSGNSSIPPSKTSPPLRPPRLS